MSNLGNNEPSKPLSDHSIHASTTSTCSSSGSKGENGILHRSNSTGSLNLTNIFRQPVSTFQIFCSYCWNIQFFSIILFTVNTLLCGLCIMLVGYFFTVDQLTTNIKLSKKINVDNLVSEFDSLYTQFSNHILEVKVSLKYYQLMTNMTIRYTPENVDGIMRLFSVVTSEYNSVINTGVIRMLGYKEGDIIVVDRNTGDFYKTEDINGTKSLLYSTIDFGRLEVSGNPLNYGYYNCTVRTWYVLGNTLGENDIAIGDLFIPRGVRKTISKTVVTKIYDYITNEFVGVLGVNIFMDDFLTVVDQADKKYDADIIILTDMKGIVITNSKLNHTNEGVWTMDQSQYTLIRDLGKTIIKKYGTYDKFSENVNNGRDSIFSFHYISNEHDYHVDVGVHSDMKLNVYFVYSKMKNDNFISNYNNNGLLASSGFIISSILIALIFSYVITSPIKKAAEKIKKISVLEDIDMKNSKLSVFKFHELKLIRNSLKLLVRGFDNFKKFIPIEVLRYLLLSQRAIRTELWEKYLTVVFIDINKFTSRTENMQKSDLVKLLSDFFTVCEQYISVHSGTVDKYIGDCVMCIFGAPSFLDHHEIAAVNCALDILNYFKNKSFKDQNGTSYKIAIKIGINSCLCLCGFIGSPDRLSFTVLGDGVNVANRLEETNKELGTEILIGERTFFHVKTHFKCENKGKVILRGRTEENVVYSVTGPLAKEAVVVKDVVIMN